MWSENEEKITRITMQVGDVTTKWEAPYTDCDMDDLLTAFAGLCISHTWLPITVYEEMERFAKDQMEVLKGREKEENEDLYMNN